LTPHAVLGVIAESLLLAVPGESVTLEVLLERFDPDRLPRTPWVVIPSRQLRSGT
jgi:glutamyl-tRNA synthetase